MEVKGYKSRLIDKKIELYLEVFKAILIEGPKGVEKLGLENVILTVSFF